MHYQWISHPQQLRHIIEQMQATSCHILDTEFIKVNTLYPKLGVLQMNTQQDVYLIDGTLDLSAIWLEIFKAKQNIFHACGEDIDLIYHYAKQRPLNNVFDTQIAMSFLGYGLQVGYQAALEKVLNIHVEKDQTRSDWLARPLSDEQMRYAATDVFYLGDLAEQLTQELQQKGLYEYAWEDCQSFCASIAHEYSVEEVYLDVANYRHSSRQLMQLKQITTWREQLAVKLNIPRSFIIKNNSINNLLQRTPKTLHQLVATNELRHSIIRDYGKTILKLLNQLPDQSEWPVRLAKPSRYHLDYTKDRLEQKISEVAQKMAIPVDVLIRKKWMTQLNILVSDSQEDHANLNPYLRGWRYQHLTLPLIEILKEDHQAGLIAPITPQQSMCIEHDVDRS